MRRKISRASSGDRRGRSIGQRSARRRPGSKIDLPLVVVKDLHKSFGSFKAIDGVDLSIAPSEKVAIIGSSGSGKTTLLRCIAYLEKPTNGLITIDGKSIGEKVVGARKVPMSDKEIAQIRTGIGMVFQRFNLFPHLTALENIMLGPLKVLRRKREDVEPIARDLLQKVGLPHKANAYPDHLSGGSSSGSPSHDLLR